MHRLSWAVVAISFAIVMVVLAADASPFGSEPIKTAQSLNPERLEAAKIATNGGAQAGSGLDGIATAVQSQVSPGCVVSPLPTVPGPNSVTYNVTNRIYSGPKSFQMVFWRATCADNAANSVILGRVIVPPGQGVQLCDGGNGGSIVQNGKTLPGAVADSTNPADGANGLGSLICGTVSTSTTYVLVPFGANAGSFNDQASFQYFYGDDFEGRVTVPAASGIVALKPQTGWWWNPNEGGRGYSLELSPTTGSIFFAAYMYDPAGNAVWYVSTLKSMDTNSYQGDLVEYRGGQTLASAYKPPETNATIGVVKVLFSSATTAGLSIVGPGVYATAVDIQRYPIVTNGLTAAASPSQPQTGWWWNASEGGRGYFLEIQSNTMFMAAYMYDTNSKPVWYVSQGAMTSNSVFAGALAVYGNGQTLGGPYVSAALVNSNIGAINFQFSSPSNGVLTFPNGSKVNIQRYSF